MYHALKRIPFLGMYVVRAWLWFQGSAFSLYVLKQKDKRKATEVVSSLFGEKGVTYLNEFINSPLFSQNYSYGHSGDFDVMILYTVVRAQRPEIVLETGVASGRSSMAILSALNANNFGTLYSIDLPQFFTSEPTTYRTHEGNNELTGFVPAGKQPGWLVPQELRGRWSLILGDAKLELVKLLPSLKKIDVFYHDSDHSGEHMQFEFDSVYPKVVEKGYVLSDDVSWNDAWKNFIEQKNLNQICTYRNFGIAQK